jgi:hypothetical protein
MDASGSIATTSVRPSGSARTITLQGNIAPIRALART